MSRIQTKYIEDNAVTNAKLDQMPAHTIKGNNTGSTANASDLTATQVTAELNQFTSSLQGVVPPSGGGTINFMRADGIWAAAGGGSSVPNSEIYVSYATGIGSTNTSVRTFNSTPIVSMGTDITYTSSTTDGDSFTINSTGTYSVSYWDSCSTAVDFGITVNSPSLSTNVISVALPYLKAVGTTSAANYLTTLSWTGYLSAGDVVRAQTDVGYSAVGPAGGGFTITRVVGTQGAQGTQGVAGGVAGYWAGYVVNDNALYWNTGSGSFADPTLYAGSVTLVETQNDSFGTVTAAGSNLPGITFTPASATAVYMVVFQVMVNDAGTSGSYVNLRLWDGTTVISTGIAVPSYGATGAPNTVTLTGLYAPGSTSAKTLTVQFAGPSAGIQAPQAPLINPLEFTVVRIK